MDTAKQPNDSLHQTHPAKWQRLALATAAPDLIAVLAGVRRSALGGMADISPDILASSSVTVAAGERLVPGIPEEDVMEVSAEEIEVKLSWRRGTLFFEASH